MGIIFPMEFSKLVIFKDKNLNGFTYIYQTDTCNLMSVILFKAVTLRDSGIVVLGTYFESFSPSLFPSVYQAIYPCI